MTNKTISLTIPNDDPIALHEFGAAMQRMAGRHGLEVPQAVTGLVPHEVAKEIMTERKAAIREAMTRDTDKAQLAALGEAVEIVKAAAPVLLDDNFKYDGEEVSGPRTDTTPSHLDSDGLPWDARIHASSKERNADDTWRARRKPSDMDAGQWAEFQGQVRTELRALMELPVEPSLSEWVELSKESVEQEVAAVLDEQPEPDEPTPVVVEPVEPEPIVVTPPPVVAPPAPVEPVVPVAPPAPTGTGQDQYVECLIKLGVSTETAREVMSAGNPAALFVPFLQWITSSGITPEQVNVALAQHGLDTLTKVKQRPELIPQVHATLAAGV